MNGACGVEQGPNLPAHGQRVPAHGDRPSTYIPEPPDSIGGPCVKPEQTGMQAPGFGGYGSGVAAADWQGNSTMMNGDEALTQVCFFMRSPCPYPSMPLQVSCV